MADETSSSMDGKFAALTQKVERESRFTRTLVVICTVANLGVMFYIVKEMFTDLPMAIFSTFEGKLDVVYYHWNALTNTHGRGPSGGEEPAPAAPVKGEAAK